MSLQVKVQFSLFLISIFWGVLLVPAYDGLRLIRKLVKHSVLITSLEDVIFWVCAGIKVFSLIYQYNNGMMRSFIILGMSLGVCLYLIIISPILLTITYKILNFILEFIKKIVKYCLKPLKKIVKKVKIKSRIREKKQKGDSDDKTQTK